jgi:predicted O-methyltransferase YrrM
MASKNHSDEVVAIYRNEYGVLKVHDRSDKRTLSHGNTLHGFQVHDPAWHNRPTSYYSPGSGLGLVMRYLRQDWDTADTDPAAANPAAATSAADHSAPANAPAANPTGASLALAGQRPLRLAAIGLGTGTVAAWGRAGDRIRFFEIDPNVVQVARRHFTYLHTSQAECEVVLGDARVQLEREQRAGAPAYDVLIADAFSSDSIPKHLLTTEALQVYLDRITADGMVAIHVSNRFIELAPLLQRQADDLGVAALHVTYNPQTEREEDAHQYASSWVLLTRNPLFTQHPRVQAATKPFPSQASQVRWTDDFAPLLPLLREQPLRDWWPAEE